MSIRLPAAERREQLLKVALQSFAAAGFHATSMNHIAAAAGVTKPVLYQHFASKDELFAEVVTTAGTELRIRVENAISNAEDSHDQVTLAFRAFIGTLAADEATYRVLFADSLRHDQVANQEIAAVERSMAAVIADELRDLSEDLSVRLMLGHAIVGMSEGALRHWYADDYDLEPEDLAAHLAELAWAGLRGSKPAAP